LNSNGYVGVGIANPQQALDVLGNQYDENLLFFKDTYSSANQQFFLQNWNNYFYICNATNFAQTSCPFSLSHTGVAVFSSNVNATAFYTTSDERLKTNIQTFPDALRVVKQLRGVTFDWKKDGMPSAGVIAQEVEKVLPSAVTTNPTTGMKSVEYSQLVAPLIEAVKDIATVSDTFKTTLIAWLADAQNGITDLFAQTIHTQKLCTTRSDGTQICITNDQLAELLVSHMACKTQ